MEDRLGCIFQVDAAALHLFAALGLDNRAASSYTSVHASGISILGQAQDQALLYCGLDNQSGLDYQLVQRCVRQSIESALWLWQRT